MDKQGRRSMSSPPNWKTRTLRHQDMAVNDEDSSGSNSRHKQMEAASRLGGQMPEPLVTERNRPLPRERNATAPSVKLESTAAEPLSYLNMKEEYPHGSGWKDQIRSLFHNGGGWEDPICTLFPTKDLATCRVETPDAGGSFTVATPFKESDASSKRVDLKQNMTGRLPPMPTQYQADFFQDTGFPAALIQRAILLHGAQADDSIILQFLLEWRDNSDVLEANCQKQFKHSESKLPSNEETKITEENDSGLLTKRQQIASPMKRDGAEQLLDSEDVDSSDSDFDDDDEASPCKPGSDYPVSLCERKLPTGEGYRHLMSNNGFSAELVVRAIQELGEGVDYDMLLEYLLYITAQQDPKVATSASCVERACTAKKMVKECGHPTKQQASSQKRKNTVEILVEECGYPAMAVERALVICGTPLWNPERDQMADLVDFLAAHCAGFYKSVDKADVDEDSQGDPSRSWLREHREETASTSGGGKRKLGYGSVVRGKSIFCLNSASNFKQDQDGHPPHSRTPILKRENSNQPSLNMNWSCSRMAKVKLAPSQRRYTPVGRIGRSRVVKEEVSIVLDRHEGSVGFGLPGNPVQSRYLDEDLKGAPFFYFENVASMPTDEWDRIRRHLFDIEPEFVDSLHFSACRRPRGYIHNLPIEGRRKILVDPPMTIQELLPHTKAFWPAWDPRTKLNCITTRMGSEFLIKKLHIGEGTALQSADPSPEQQREILHLCRHWNLVWTAPNIPTPINEIEIEAMLGFDAGHSRNILSNRSRHKALGNSFSVYTVAFHLSVLKPLYPMGIKVLSLFSGIGGAEVALHKMGVKLLVVVSIEIDDGTRRCLEAWWASSKQTGVLNQNYRNIKDLGRAQISELVNMYGGFDLIVGGTPCNNLSGSNHVTRVGLDGKQSTIFFEFSRVVAAVRELTIRLQRR